MIPNQVDVVEVESSGFADSFGMTIDEQSLVHIMDVLTKMYSDSALAVIREYSANALDSHVKAGNTAPIQVTLPSRWNNMFVVRDFGVGMNVDYMRNVYSKYGASDKRESDDFIGGFGIGSKAGLAYSHSFTVTAWQDGMRSRAIVSIDEAGAGKFDIVDVVESDEPTGVEIKIAVKGDTVEFSRKARDFFAFWKPGTVLINDEEPEYVGGTAVSDALMYNKTSRWEQKKSYVVVGSVPYVLDMDKISQGRRLTDAGISIILRLGVGEVAIAPSREALAYTPGTIAAIEAHTASLWDTIVQAEVDKINAATTFKEAHGLLSQVGYPFSDLPQFKNFTYEGVAYVQRFMHQHYTLYWDYNGRGMVDQRHQVDISHTLQNVELIVTGFGGMVVSTVIKRKIKHYASENGLSTRRVLITNVDFDNEWVSEIKRVDIETIKAVKLPAGQYVANKKIPTFDVYTKDGYKSETKVTGKNILYCSPVDVKKTDRWGTVQKVNLPKVAEMLDATIVEISRNRFDKFLRENPKARPLQKVINEKIGALVKASNDFEVTKETVRDWSVRTFLAKVDASTLLDADLIKVVNAYRSGKADPNFSQAVELHNYAVRGTMSIDAPQRKVNRADDVLDKYPLLTAATERNIDHLVIYVNAVFEKENI